MTASPGRAGHLRRRPGDLRPGQPAPYSYLPWLTIALIAAGVIYMLMLQATRPRALSQAVSLLEGEVEAASGAT